MVKKLLTDFLDKGNDYLFKFFNEEDEVTSGNDSSSVADEMLSFGRLHEVLPYESYDEESEFYYNKSTTGFVIKGNPLAGAAVQSQEKLNEFLKSTNNFPVGTSMQVMMYASPKINWKLDWYLSPRKEHPVFKKLAEKRVDYLKKKAKNDIDGHIVRDYMVYISYTLPFKISSKREEEELNRIKQKLVRTLRDVGMYTRSVGPGELINDLTGIIDFDFEVNSKNRKWDELNSISSQIGYGSCEYELLNDRVRINNSRGKFASRSYVVKDSPTHWSLGQMGTFLGDVFSSTSVIPCPYILHYGFHIDNRQVLQTKKIQLKRANLEKLSRQKYARFRPNLEEQISEFAEAEKNTKDSDRVITACFSATLFCEEEMLEDCESELFNVWQAAGWRFGQATWNHLLIMLASLPMAWSLGWYKENFYSKKKLQGYGAVLETFARAKKTLVSEAQNMLPIVGEWQGQEAPGVPLIGYHGQLFFFNPFDGFLLPGIELSNASSSYNLCISGTMGSGKSVVAQEIIATVAGVGGKVFVLDKGESFKELCISVGGHHIDFNISANISLNPFTNIPEGHNHSDTEDRIEQMVALTEIVATMAMPNHGASPTEIGIVNAAIRAVWKSKGRNGEINDIVESLLNNSDQRAIDIGNNMHDYGREGLYGHLFNGKATIDLRHDFVTIETQNIKNSLKSVVVQIMVVNVWNQMISSDRKRPYLMFIDEAWDALSGRHSQKFIESVSRTARKYRASLALATQNMTDYFEQDNLAARSAFENAAWKIVMFQDEDVTEAMKGHEHLKNFVKNLYLENIIKSLSQAKRCSEMIIYGLGLKGIPARLWLDPYSLLLYSTKAQDVMELREVMLKHGVAIDQAIEEVLALRSGKASIFPANQPIAVSSNSDAEQKIA